MLLDLNVYKEELEERVVSLGAEAAESEKELTALRGRELVLNEAHRVELERRDEELRELKTQFARDDELEGREERRSLQHEVV